MQSDSGDTENGLSEEEIVGGLDQQFPSGVEMEKTRPRRIEVRVDKEVLFDFCKTLKEEYGFDHVSSVTGVDMEDKMVGVYHISSYPNQCMIEILVDLPRDEPEVDSITPLWEGANWHEREAYDLLGIVYRNHPDLRRIMLPEDTEFHPLRKDFKIGGSP